MDSAGLSSASRAGCIRSERFALQTSALCHTWKARSVGGGIDQEDELSLFFAMEWTGRRNDRHLLIGL